MSVLQTLPYFLKEDECIELMGSVFEEQGKLKSHVMTLQPCDDGTTYVVSRVLQGLRSPRPALHWPIEVVLRSWERT